MTGWISLRVNAPWIWLCCRYYYTRLNPACHVVIKSDFNFVQIWLMGLSQKRLLWSKAWCCVSEILLKFDDWGGVNRHCRFGVNRPCQFRGGGVNCTDDLPSNHQVSVTPNRLYDLPPPPKIGRDDLPQIDSDDLPQICSDLPPPQNSTCRSDVLN